MFSTTGTAAAQISAAFDAAAARRTAVSASLSRCDASSRFASGRTFSRRGEVWVEAGLGNRSPDRRIVAWSQAYFDLLRSHPELREALALGERVVLSVGREVIEVTAR